ncbi:phosphatidylinositol-3-phosphatase SAC1 [Hydra vulgaris]|uniref:Phosphatidylinositol-3-phosphatase SAC1 n=1 Tax=Hydra vulgaris TaxID=6087 RepID=T2M4V7_HYDVU|nr:phosphatidylinositol-3-phosphatase SAC1 [Hydra vulgaris]
MGIYKVLRLYTTAEKFYVQPLVHVGENPKILEIDRLTNELFLNENKGQIPPRSAEVREIYGILGILQLIAGPYLVVVSKRKVVGLINGEEIWQMKEADLIPFPKSTTHLTESQIRDNKIFIQMASSALQTDGFYFSYTFDITHSAQRLYNTSSDFKDAPLYERADHRFVWNQSMLNLFIVQPELSSFVLPLMHGFVEIKKCSIKQYPLDFILISRRSCYRAGTRYNIRGLDESGEAANYVETEQLICCNNEIASFVQTRGSIPLYWSQYPTIKYKPKPMLTPSCNNIEGFKRHIDNQLAYYGKQILINLIDQKGSEKVIGDKFKEIALHSGYNEIQLKYVAFDFHKECSKMRWNRLDLLLDQLKNSIFAMSYFRVQHDRNIVEQQSGVFRTNCIDCLDRTNVVQSMIAKYVLEKQLQAMGVLGVENHITDYSDFEFTFKNVWADNADMIAHQYTGTGALKTDFTRTGKRSSFGVLQDGVNSLIRYYKNNFADGFRQDGIDLILGNYNISTNDKVSPLKIQTGYKYLALPAIFLIGFSMLIISLLLPATDFRLQLTYILFWGVACLITLYFVSLYGTELVDKPRLVHKWHKSAKF